MQTMLDESPLKEDPIDPRLEFQQFYRENLGSIYRYVYSQVGNSEEAEDLTSQNFLKVVSSIDQERSLLSMKKWLYLIARSIIEDYWRAHYRLPKSSLDAMLEAGWEGPAEVEVVATGSGAEERVERLLRALPEKYREVLKCRFLLKLSVNATALKMGVTEAKVKVLQFRALRRAAEVEQVAIEKNVARCQDIHCNARPHDQTEREHLHLSEQSLRLQPPDANSPYMQEIFVVT